MDILFMVIGFFVLLFLGFPIYAALSIPSLILLLIMGVPLPMIALKTVTTLDSFTMMAAMFFILAGNLMNSYGVSEKLFNLAEKTVGHLRGGLAHANIIASVIFAGMSGAALADAAVVARVSVTLSVAHSQ